MEWVKVNVVGFEHLYEVSRTGAVRSLDRVRPSRWPGRPYVTKGRVLRQQPNHKGYMTVTLCSDTRRVSFFVHHLVLGAFCLEPRDGRECRHLDGNPANNHIDNLAWGNAKQNAADCLQHGTRLTKLDVAQVRQIKDLLAAGVSQYDIATQFGVSQPSISDINKGVTWRHLS